MKNKILAVFLCVSFLAGIGMTSYANDTEDINEIYVRYNGVDATENIKAALNEAENTPGRDRVILRSPGKNKKWISGPFWVSSNIELYLEEDTILEAKKGAFPFYRQSFINIEDEKNVSIIGANSETSVIQMNINEYTDGEWRNIINIAGGKNIIVRGLYLSKAGGDGISISDLDLINDVPTEANENILVDDVIIDGASRNGISLISGENIIINNTTIRNVGLFNPPGLSAGGPFAGIDIEPEARKVINHIKIYNSTFDNIARNGLSVNPYKLSHLTEPWDIIMKNCTMTNNGANIAYINFFPGERKEYSLLFENCIFSSSNDACMGFSEFAHEEGSEIKIKDCIFSNSYANENEAMILLRGNPHLNGEAEFDLGGVNFENVYSFGSMAKNFIMFTGGNEQYKIKDVTGKIYSDKEENVVYNTQHFENVDLAVEVSPVKKNDIVLEIMEKSKKYEEEGKELVREMEEKIISDYLNSDDYHGIRVKVNGEIIDFADQKPIIINDRVLVPMRSIFEKIGAEVVWDDATKSVNAKRGNAEINLTLGSLYATKNGKSIKLDVAPQLLGGRTMVPLRFVAEAIGAKVEWQPDPKYVVITTRGEIRPQHINGNEIIVDCNTEGYSETGAIWFDWESEYKNHDDSTIRVSTFQSLAEPYSPKAIFTPEISQAGEYDVYVYKYAYPNSDSAAGFEIVHGNGSMVNCPTQNWQQGETGWVKLTTETGPLHFDEQTVSGKQHVKFKKTAPGTMYIKGTAVKFVKVN